MILTDTKLRSAKTKESSYRLTDGHGLYVLINPGGSKLWRCKYKFAGKEADTSFGAYPAQCRLLTLVPHMPKVESCWLRARIRWQKRKLKLSHREW